MYIIRLLLHEIDYLTVYVYEIKKTAKKLVDTLLTFFKIIMGKYNQRLKNKTMQIDQCISSSMILFLTRMPLQHSMSSNMSCNIVAHNHDCEASIYAFLIL